jgi:hypothetical protein
MTVVNASPDDKPTKRKRGRPIGSKTKANDVPIYMISLDQPGRVRKPQFRHLLGGISESSFWKKSQKGLLPKPDGNDGRPRWSTETVRKYL